MFSLVQISVADIDIVETRKRRSAKPIQPYNIVVGWSDVIIFEGLYLFDQRPRNITIT